MGKTLPGTTTLLTRMKPRLGQERTGFTVATGKRKPWYSAIVYKAYRRNTDNEG